MKNSNLTKLFNNDLYTLISNILYLKKNLLKFLLSVLIGIFFGSIFGTFLPFFRKIIFWDGLIILSIIFFGEWISSLTYKTNLSQNKLPFLNWVKIGIFLGLFIDALKVGS